MSPLPVLNLQLQRQNPTLFAKQLVSACHKIGFFLLEHDLDSVCQRALNETSLFFQKPLDQKMSIYYGNQRSFRGYMPLGVENTEGKIDGREQIEYAAEYGKWRKNCNDSRFEESRIYHRLRVAENPWPDQIQPTLRPAINDYVDGVLAIGDQLRDALCLGMGIDPNKISNAMFRKASGDDEEPNFWSMKLVSYPPPVRNSNTNKNISDSEFGVGAHADSNFLTMILQDDSHSGLQVQTIDGKWIDVPPTPPNVLICNIGELAQIFSGGYLMATPHRVLRPQGRRISLPIFYNPKLDHVMESMVDPKDLVWERKGQNQWLRKENALMGSVGENSLKSLSRSHPEVFKRHHPDLEILRDGRIQQKKNI